jgi:orotate phosphoribosyltransferase
MRRAGAAGTLFSARHVALRTGWHCSRYYQFSRLLGEGEFLDNLAAGLSALYGNDKFTYLVGIGTAGAQIASRLSLLLGTRFSYTFAAGTAAAEPGLRSGTTEYERELSPPPAARVLIVDDIVGKGTALAEIVARLEQDVNKPVLLQAFSLIATGDASELASIGEEVELQALAIATEVEYWPEGDDAFCDMCRGQKDIVARER